MAALLLAALMLGGVLTLYRYMTYTLFQERSYHFIEMSDKITGISGATADRYWAAVNTAENLLEMTGAQDLEQLPSRLERIQSCLDLEHGVLLAFDSNLQFYTADGESGGWREAALLSNGLVRQTAAAELNYWENGETCIFFIKQLDTPLDAGGRYVTHIAAAAEMAAFQGSLDASTLQGQYYTYVVDSSGRKLCEYPGGFLEGNNLLTALSRYEFIHGEGPEELRRNLSEQTSGSYEFLYGRQRYFLAASPVSGTDWSLLIFTPTKLLRAGGVSLLNTTIRWIAFIAVLAAMLVAMLAAFFATKRGDQRIIRSQQEANALLQDAADAAAAASLAKSDFLTHMSRDIRTPINGIMGMADIALKNPGNPEQVQECLQKIHSAANRLLRQFTDVLDMSQLESGETRVRHESMNMVQIGENCVSIIERQMQGRNLRLIKQFRTLSHPQVFGDEPHLRQVLINLLSNAVKFTPDGGKIYFRIHELDIDGAHVMFRMEVEDTGIGMEPELLEHIFEPFAHIAAGGGNGLGMAVTRQFVDLMGGIITVESSPGEGTRFVVELPAEVDGEYQTEEPAPEDIPESGQEENSLEGVRLLLAEDNELNMEIARCILEDWGVEVVPAMNGREALDAFAASEPDTFDGILMDMMMPVMDGLAATRAIRALDRADAKNVPIFAVTVNVFEEDERRCLEAGMNAHVAKPIDGDILYKTLSRHIQPKTSGEI